MPFLNLLDDGIGEAWCAERRLTKKVPNQISSKGVGSGAAAVSAPPEPAPGQDLAGAI